MKQYTKGSEKTSVATLKKVDGQLMIFLDVQFGFGNVVIQEEGKIYPRMTSKNAEEFVRELIENKVETGNKEGLNDLLNQFFIYKLYNMIGIEQYPINMDKTGKVTGFSEDIKVVLENE